MVNNIRMPSFERSTRKNKKYMTLGNNGKVIHFGDKRYEHYEDKALGLYKDMNHYDPKRREAYRSRARGIKDKDGNYTYLDMNSPNYYSYNFLW